MNVQSFIVAVLDKMTQMHHHMIAMIIIVIIHLLLKVSNTPALLYREVDHL